MSSFIARRAHDKCGMNSAHFDITHWQRPRKSTTQLFQMCDDALRDFCCFVASIAVDARRDLSLFCFLLSFCSFFSFFFDFDPPEESAAGATSAA
jgi:hypothetical protein|eukprot:SAG25_NODE_139_length_14140_cov_7.185101_8_plen_95_part_00